MWSVGCEVAQMGKLDAKRRRSETGLDWTETGSVTKKKKQNVHVDS